MKRINLRLLCRIVVLLSCVSVYAQSNYRPGFIITLKQDTVYGQIDFRTDRINALRCVFKSKEDAEPVTCLPFEITGYRFTDDGKYYVSRMIKTDEDKEAMPVFLEYLLEGIKSLYYYESKDNREFYFIQDGKQLVVLDAPELEKMKREGFIANGQTDRYVPTLQYIFRDCPGLAPEILKTTFSHKGLIKIAKEYHDAVCTTNKECIIFENKAGKRKGVQVLFTPYAGIVQYDYQSLGNAQRPELSYMVGINLAVTNRRWKRVLSGVVDFSLSRLTMLPNPPYNTPEYDLTATAFSIKLGIRLEYPKGKVRPFLEGGGDFFKRLKKDELRDVFPGGYIGTGLSMKLARNERQSLVVRVQFEKVRDVLGATNLLEEPCPFLNAWSAVMGYTF